MQFIMFVDEVKKFAKNCSFEDDLTKSNIFLKGSRFISNNSLSLMDLMVQSLLL